jgi:hypothetical protein
MLCAKKVTKLPDLTVLEEGGGVAKKAGASHLEPTDYRQVEFTFSRAKTPKAPKRQRRQNTKRVKTQKAPKRHKRQNT